MDIQGKDVKINRILTIYSKLLNKQIINKKDLALKFNVNEKTIQRDIDDLRAYFSQNTDTLGFKDIVYKRDKKGYILDGSDKSITKEDMLVICKIVLESRSLCKSEMKHLIESIIAQLDSDDKKNIESLIGNELLNYVPVNHNQNLLTKIWDLSNAIRSKQLLKIMYKRQDGEIYPRTIQPVGIIFSEYYFYIISYSTKHNSPVIYRIDRIQDYELLNERFQIPHSQRFEDGEFRKRIQFMYNGELMKIKFEFTGSSIEAVLDRLPIAKVLEQNDNKYIVESEVYGHGIKMWLLSQGRNIKVLEPANLVKEMIDEIKHMTDRY